MISEEEGTLNIFCDMESDLKANEILTFKKNISFTYNNYNIKIIFDFWF